MTYQLPTEIQNIIWTHEFYLVILYIITEGPLFSTKMTKLFSKLNLTKLFYILPQRGQETIIDQLVDTTRKLSQS